MQKILTLTCMLTLFFMAICSTSISADWSKLPDTGQDDCYDENGNPLVCPGPSSPLFGQDASYQGTLPAYSLQSVDGDTVVLDENTGLVWQQKGYVLYGGITHGYLFWQDAIAYCDSLVYADRNDWRLPSRRELESIVNYDIGGSGIDDIFAINTGAARYWSSTECVNNNNNAWIIGFGGGGHTCSQPKTSGQNVRCVSD